MDITRTEKNTMPEQVQENMDNIKVVNDKIDARPVGLIDKGTWTRGRHYYPQQVVYYDGTSYVCIASIISYRTPDIDTIHFKPFAIQGEQGEQGVPGATGNGISSITLISSVGLVDTYRIAFTNGSHYDYTVTNGQTYTFDNTPTQNSQNPVTSDGIFAALQGIGTFIIDSSYFDPVTNSAASRTMNYIKTKKIIGGRSLIIVWGTTPETDSNGYLTGAASGVGWVPTSSEGVKANLFTNVANYRVVAMPYAGTQYSYGWRVVNYMRDGYGGFNIRYGNNTSGIAFSYIMIGTEA